MYAIVEKNPETNKFIVSIWRMDTAPSGYKRTIYVGQSKEMEEKEAKELYKKQNEVYKENGILDKC